MINPTGPVYISPQPRDGDGGWFSDLERRLPSAPVFRERMELRRARLSGASQGGYSRTTGDLLGEDSLKEARAALDRCRIENAREWGYRRSWSRGRCQALGIYAPPERSLEPQQRALRGLEADAEYFGLGAVGADPLFRYLKTGELRLSAPPSGDPPAPSGAVASALNARLHRVSYGVATSTRDQIFTRAVPRT